MFNKENESQALTIFFFSPNESQPIMENMNCVGACARKHIPYKPSTKQRGDANIHFNQKQKTIKTKQNSFKDVTSYNRNPTNFQKYAFLYSVRKQNNEQHVK